MAEKTEINKVSKKLAEDLLKKAGVEAKVEIKVEDETVLVNILGDDLGILIGFHGETLKALQILLGVMINRKVGGEWRRVVVDVANWRSSRQVSLEEMATKALTQVVETGESLALPPMTPDERRLIHLYLQEKGDVISHSEGEGNERHIVISPK